MNQENQNPNLQVEVRDPQLISGVHYYNIKLTDKGNKDNIVIFTQKQRYKSLRELHKDLQGSLGEDKLPNFPKKRWFGTTDQQFVSQRLKELQYYFHTLLNQYPIDMPEMKPLKSFLTSKVRKVEQPKMSPQKNSNENQQQSQENLNQQEKSNQQNQQQQQQQQNNNKQDEGKQTQNQEKIKNQIQNVKKHEPQEKMQEILDKLQREFINLTDDFNNPPEGYQTKKRADYDKLRHQFKNNISNTYTVPQGNPENINNENLLNIQDFEALNDLESKMTEICFNIDNIISPVQAGEYVKFVTKFEDDQQEE